MSEAGDDIPIDAPEEQVEVTAPDSVAPKGKLTVEEALQVRPKYSSSSGLKSHDAVTL